MTARKVFMLKLGIQLTIALLLSFVMTLINFGFSGNFIHNWIKGFVVAFFIIPLALSLIPIVANAIRLMARNCPTLALRSLTAVCVAALMEGMIALAVTVVQLGASPGWMNVWFTTFVKALPLGLIIGVTMTFIVQPRMQKLASLQTN